MATGAADGEGGVSGVRGLRCPRCAACGRVVRVRGVGVGGVLCSGCLGGALPFLGIVGEGDFRVALREYREGLGSRAGDFEGLRFDPFDDEVRGVLGRVDGTLRGCGYRGGDEVAGRLAGFAKGGGCSLSLLFHNIRSAKGGGLEMLEAEVRRWGVEWDVVGLAETWLDEESEKRVALGGMGVVCASRRDQGGVGWRSLLGTDLRTGRDRTWGYLSRVGLSRFLLRL